MKGARVVAVLTVLLSVAGSAEAEVSLENPRVRMVLSDSAQWRSLVDKASGRELMPAGVRMPLAVATIDGKGHNCTGAALAGTELKVKFEGVDTEATYEVNAGPDWIVFALKSFAGQRPERMRFVSIPVAITQNVGRRLNIAWDERTSVCLMAASHQSDCSARRGKYATLDAATQDAPGPKMEGASAALICGPTAEIRRLLKKASHEFGLLTNEDARGVPVKETDLARGSYWFLTLGPKDADRLIQYCEKTGFKQVMMGSGSWCRTVGHYTFRQDRFRDEDELKQFVDKLHAQGIKVGMHAFVSKVSKRDAYVTPVPDMRFWKDMKTSLAEDITAEQREIRCTGSLGQWPGSPVSKKKYWEGGVKKHQEVVLGHEIVQYEAIGPEGKYDTFLGCRRGAWGTTAAAHRAGEVGYHFGVDGCINGYIIDQETDLLDEVTDRIAQIFNYCGFDMVYFDGGEDVPRTRFSYYVSKFQEAAMRKFRKRPIIHMGTIMTHLLWHSFARSSTVDTYLSTLHGAIISGRPVEQWPTVKAHINRSVRYMLSVRQDLMPGELGWFGIWPKGKNTDGLQLDEIEYLMCKSLGYDVPISLQTSFSQMEAHVLTPEILKIVKAYEGLRMSGAVPEATRKKLQELDQDFVLLQYEGRPEFVEVSEVPEVAGTHDVRCFVGSRPGGAVATMWHYLREGEVLLPIEPSKVRVTDFSGKTIETKAEEGKLLVPIGHQRTTLLFSGLTPEQVREALEQAELRVRPPAYVWVRAEDCRRFEGEMALGSKVGLKDPEALGDFIVCTGAPALGKQKDWYCEYTVELPHEGRWTLWARVRYPTGGDMSFGIVQPGEEVTLGGKQVLGNCGVNDKKWHWTGRGGGSTTAPPGQPITFKLPKGPFTFRIYAREGGGKAEVNPRLDCLCFTDEIETMPNDEIAAKALGGR